MGQANRPMLGIAYMMASLMAMALLTALVKLVSESQSVSEILFFRFFGSLLPLALILRRSGGLSLLRTADPLQHGLRITFGLGGLACYFYAVASIPLADATALAYTAPIFVVLLSQPILGERITGLKILAILVGFVGVLLIARPVGGAISGGTLAAVGGAIFGALVSIWIRKLNRKDPAITIAVFYNGSAAIVMLCWLLATGWHISLNVNLILMLCIGLIAGAQQYLMTRSFSYAEAGFLAQFEYVMLIFAAITGWVFWQETLTLHTLLGAIIITASGLFIARKA